MRPCSKARGPPGKPVSPDRRRKIWARSSRSFRPIEEMGWHTLSAAGFVLDGGFLEPRIERLAGDPQDLRSPALVADRLAHGALQGFAALGLGIACGLLDRPGTPIRSTRDRPEV